MRLDHIVALQPVTVGRLQITPLPLIHVVPTFGFLIEDATSAVAIISDTHHGSDVWTHLAQVNNLRAVFLECSFPNKLDWLADKAKHLIPRTFATEMQQLPATVRVIAIHIKPAWYDPIVAEIQALGLPNVEISQVGMDYQF